MVYVKNLHQADAKIPGGALNAWKDHKGIGLKENIICVRCKKNIARHGGHVIKSSPDADKKRYIVPLCVQCNEAKDDKPFSVRNDDLVWIGELKP